MAKRQTNLAKIVHPSSKIQTKSYKNMLYSLLIFTASNIQRTNLSQDRLSDLPDEILVSILSLLKLEERQRTSILSRRLQPVWEKFKCHEISIADFRTALSSERSEFISYSLESLTDLSLTNVEVTGEVLEYVLSNCPFIEILHVEASRLLALCQAKAFKDKYTQYLEHIQIHAINLVSFEYFGCETTRILLGDVPNFVSLSVMGGYFGYLFKNGCPISHYFSQLETLELLILVSQKNFMIVNYIYIIIFLILIMFVYKCAIFSWFNFSEIFEVPKLPKLRNLRLLKLDIHRLSWMAFFVALPFLRHSLCCKELCSSITPLLLPCDSFVAR
ncbi:hypothetical protein CFP56_022849 [Quercus suber]|uniref:F-box domain-containing protein n=1 Tax=Quercus suber TaxID=58331 RepID=A0AAW0KEF4_QUESU